MRLLRRKDGDSFELIDFGDGHTVPPYAILSHTWLPDGQEVLYEDMLNDQSRAKTQSYAKIRFCSEQAAKDDLEYFWVDTCCINRQNAPELQEAITSMFRWYRRAAKCYVYMSDVHVEKREARQSHPMWWEADFRKSRWFTRGWTLQELLAPASVEFFSAQGVRLGDKTSLQKWISEVTGIPLSALQGEPLSNFHVTDRLNWAADRETTRKEDRAYCLLGIFDVHMPLIYGEDDNAFFRLRKKLNKKFPESMELDHLLDTLPTSHGAAWDSVDSQHESMCLKGTRVELIQEINEWVHSPDGRCIFWLNGIAGTGKSTIARTIARDHAGQSLGASFFFQKGGGDASQAGKLVTTLASQLAHSIPSVRNHICAAIKQSGNIVEKGIREQWRQLILDPLSKVTDADRRPAILLVVDALDECRSDKDIELIFELWSETDKLNNLRLRVFVTSRPEIPVRCGFSEISETSRKGFILHEISQSTIDRDLRIFFEHRLTAVRKKRRLDSTWPNAQTIARLVELSHQLFIWAATACMYIDEGRAAAKDRATRLVNSTHPGVHESLDQLYIGVLREAVNCSRDEMKEVFGRLRRILGTVVLLESRLSAQALAKLLDMKLEAVNTSLADLHAILNIPEEDHHVLRLHHPSFRDFLLDKDRCSDKNFWIDEEDAQKALAEDCVRLMSGKLKRNLCNLQSPGSSVTDIPEMQIDSDLPLELQYACLHWAEHLRRGEGRLRQERKLRDNDETHRFLKKHFLHWVEALTILRRSSNMTAIMRTYLSLLKPGENPEQVPFLKHARMFMAAFHAEAEEAPLQLYCAALIYMPLWNQLRNHFWGELYPWLHHAHLVQADGPEEKLEYNYVNDIQFTPDGRKLASGSLEDWARVWDYSRLAEESKYEGHFDKVSSVAISRDGKLLASGSDDSTIRVFDMESRAAIHTLKAHTKWIDSVTFSPNAELLASGSMDETARLWDVSTGEELALVEPGLGGINSVSFSPDGTLLALGAADSVVHLYNIQDRRLDKTVSARLQGHEGPVNSVTFSPDGLLLASGSDDQTVRIWDVKTWEEKAVLSGHEERVWTTSFSQIMPCVVASGSEDKTVKIWNPNGKPDESLLLATLKGHTSGICAVAFAPDDRTLAAAAFNDEVRFWYTRKEPSGAVKKEPVGAVEPGGKLPDFTEDHIDASHPGQGGDILVNQHGHESSLTCLVLSADASIVASGSEDHAIKLWTTAGKETAVLQNHSDGINHLVFSPNARLLASSSADKTACIWESESGKLLHTLEGHAGSVLLVDFEPNGSLIASCSADKTIRLWDVSSGACQSTLRGHSDAVNDIAFAPKDALLASCSADTTICLWNTATATQIFDPINAHQSSVNSVKFSSDGKLLVSASADRTVKIFDTEGSPLGNLRGHTGPVNCASFSQDLDYVVSGSDDGTVRIWKRDIEREVHKLDVGVRIRDVSFSKCGRYIETDRGSLYIGSNAATPPLDALAPTSLIPASTTDVHVAEAEHNTGAVFVSDDWVKCGTDDALWLPEHFKVSRIVTRDYTAILGHASGALSFLEFRPDRSLA